MRQQRTQRMSAPTPISPTPISRTGIGLSTSGYALIVDGQAKKEFDTRDRALKSARELKGAVPKPPGQSLRCRKEAERDNRVGRNLTAGACGFCASFQSTVRKPFAFSAQLANDFENRPVHSSQINRKRGRSVSGKAVLENVLRYRTIASLYRQTAAFRPAQKWTLLEQASEWERRAMTEPEGYFTIHDSEPRWAAAA
jgi:hypothetical protein